MRLKVDITGVLLSSIVVLAMMVSVAAAKDDEVENILNNPDFELGLTGWSIGAEGVLSIDKKEDTPTGHLALLATINAAGAEDWNPEIHSPPFDVENGQRYTMDFWAKTEPETERTIGIKFEQLDTWVGPADTVTLTEEWFRALDNS